LIRRNCFSLSLSLSPRHFLFYFLPFQFPSLQHQSDANGRHTHTTKKRRRDIGLYIYRRLRASARFRLSKMGERRHFREFDGSNALSIKQALTHDGKRATIVKHHQSAIIIVFHCSTIQRTNTHVGANNKRHTGRYQSPEPTVPPRSQNLGWKFLFFSRGVNYALQHSNNNTNKK
jgi:hypothetical protein